VLSDPAVLSRIRHLHLRARQLTEALLQGEHRSRLVGQAVEFADYQEYQPGMDLRGLDWRVWARTDRYVVRRYETETELHSTIVLDLSGDMGTGKPMGDALPDLEDSKAGFAICLAATLLYFLHLHGEPVGLELIGGDDIEHRSFPCRGGRSHLQTLFRTLASIRPGGIAGLNDALLNVGSRLRRRSLVLVISDGMEEPGAWLPALAAFARRKVDLRFFHLRDEREWGLDYQQPAKFYSPEGGGALSVDPVAARNAFREVSREYEMEVRGGIVRWGGRYIPTATNGELEQVIRTAITKSGPSLGWEHA